MGKEIDAFLEENKKDVKIWCFQEVYKDFDYESQKNDGVDRSGKNFNLLASLEKILTNFNYEFCQVHEGVYGISTFVHKDIKILEKGEVTVAIGNYYDSGVDSISRDHDRKLLWLEVEIGGKNILIANTHLTHRPEGKLDSEKRLNQSKIIAEFLQKFDCPKILSGDFNLLPDTESIKIIENSGMRNLVKEYSVTSTRTPVYTKPLKFADYIFVSPEIKVNDFRVLPDVVSDHSPLLLDFDL